MEWTTEKNAELRALWADPSLAMSDIARRMGMTRGAIAGQSTRLNLHFHRHNSKHLPSEHDAAQFGTTLFLGQVKPPRETSVLKPGSYQRKLGRSVKKGKWKGFPIFSLTLEERATCPRTCHMWLSCYGNNMPWAKRYAHGLPLQDKIEAELAALQEQFPAGFVVRLHVLGDFYSVDYVSFWYMCLLKFPALNVFGYTAWHAKTPIGRAIEDLRVLHWPRFAVRTSGARVGPRTIVIADREHKPADAVICPAQVDKTASCATCALCWSTFKPIAFLKH